jgi:uncharacterized membrane protein
MRRGADRDYVVRDEVHSALATVRQAFAEFLTLPTVLIVLFLGLAVAIYALDVAPPAPLVPLHHWLNTRFFPDPTGTASLLSAVAAGIISVTSITVTLLLLVLQQSASSMTTQVFDQFLRRRSNQFFFGYFVGLALFALITQTTVSDRFVPVFGSTLVFVLTAVALYMLVLLLYSIINQTRPSEITAAIHNHVLDARDIEREVLRGTRASLADTSLPPSTVLATLHGFCTAIDVETLGRAVRQSGGGSIVLRVSLGSFVAFHDPVADVRAAASADIDALRKVVEKCVVIHRRRDVARVAVFGVEELQTIGWTSISSAQSNPAAGLTVIRAVRDLLARWAYDGVPERDDDAPAVVYVDRTIDRVFDAFETFAVASSESMQHQAMAAVIGSIAALLPRLPEPWQARAEQAVRRMLAGAGDHVPTEEIDRSLVMLEAALHECGRDDTAREVRRAMAALDRSVGRLRSRNSRA